MPKVIETLQEAIQTYPGQLDSYININVAYGYLGQLSRGSLCAESRGAAAGGCDRSENLVADYVALGRMAEARQEMERARKLGLDSSTGAAQIHLDAYFLLGEPKEVQRIVAQVAGRPDEFLVTQALAVTQQFSGSTGRRLRPSSRLLSRRGAPRLRMCRPASFCSMPRAADWRACVRATRRRCNRRWRWTRASRRRNQPLLAAAVCGNGKLALPMAQELGKKFPEDTLIQDVYVPLAKAFVALAAGQPQEAVECRRRPSHTTQSIPDLMCRVWRTCNCTMPAMR